jgi:hypothetical protein
MLECEGSPAVVVVVKTLLQPRLWLESVALRSVEARGLGLTCSVEENCLLPSSLKVGVLDGKFIVRQSRVIVHRFVPCPSSPFVEHYVMRRMHTLCP